MYYLASNLKTYSVIEMNSNSHPAPCSHNGQEQLQKIKTWTNCQSSFVANIYRKLWKSLQLFLISDHQTSWREPVANRALSPTFIANYGNLFKSFRFSDPRVDLPEPTAILNSRQRPQRNSWARHLHLHSPTNLKFPGFLPSSWSFAAHKSHLRRGGRTWYLGSNCWNCTGLDILEE